MARARGAAHGAHDDLRDRGERARERPTAVTAGSGISARRAKTAEYWSRARPAVGGDAKRGAGRPLHIHIAKKTSLAMEELDQTKMIAGPRRESNREFKGIG